MTAPEPEPIPCNAENDKGGNLEKKPKSPHHEIPSQCQCSGNKLLCSLHIKINFDHIIRTIPLHGCKSTSVNQYVCVSVCLHMCLWVGLSVYVFVSGRMHLLTVYDRVHTRVSVCLSLWRNSPYWPACRVSESRIMNQSSGRQCTEQQNSLSLLLLFPTLCCVLPLLVLLCAFIYSECVNRTHNSTSPRATTHKTEFQNVLTVDRVCTVHSGE